VSIKSLDQLTPRERAVLDELLQGKSNREIAVSLGITTQTAEVHMRSILQKTGAPSRLALVVDVYESLINGKLARKK
jgi:DNA-binding CsgD family transcriptional regulator